MTRRAEPCPIIGCIDPKARGHLMCRHHWRLVPAALRQAVNKAWKAIQGKWRGTDPEARLIAIRTYQGARDAAIAFVNPKEAA